MKIIVDVIFIDLFCFLGTPLHSAIDRKDQEIVRLLLDRGANINVQDTNGCNFIDSFLS